jgi:hypothetical protein
MAPYIVTDLMIFVLIVAQLIVRQLLSKCPTNHDTCDL